MQHSILRTILILAALWLFQFSGVMAAPRQQGQDIGIITNPPSNAIVRGAVQITGSADHPAFQFYIIEFSPEPVSGNQWQIIGNIHETPVINGVLENWDTTLIPDGSYTLRLRVVRLDGNYTEFFSQQVVVGNALPQPTDTPASTPTLQPLIPTVTPTDLPPTPTIVIEQPIVETPTPRPVPTTPSLEGPGENGSFIPQISGFSMGALRNACLFGGGLMLVVFLFFGFLSALRMFVYGFIQSRREISSFGNGGFSPDRTSVFELLKEYFKKIEEILNTFLSR
jgi:hypothetical protein